MLNGLLGEAGGYVFCGHCHKRVAKKTFHEHRRLEPIAPLGGGHAPDHISLDTSHGPQLTLDIEGHVSDEDQDGKSSDQEESTFLSDHEDQLFFSGCDEPDCDSAYNKDGCDISEVSVTY